MNLCRSAWGTLASFAFDYDTPKIVRIQNKKVGALYRLFQLGIMGFMIGYGSLFPPFHHCYLTLALQITPFTSKQVQHHILEGLSG